MAYCSDNSNTTDSGGTDDAGGTRSTFWPRKHRVIIQFERLLAVSFISTRVASADADVGVSSFCCVSCSALAGEFGLPLTVV